MTHILQNIEPTSDGLTAFQRSTLNWSVSKRKVYDESGVEIPNYWRTVRDDSNATLGMVQGRYEVMQNETLCGVPNDMIALNPKLAYSSAGELNGGRRVYASIECEPFDVVVGDTIQTYFIVTTSHDGSKATMMFLSTIRPICVNTLNAGIREATGKHQLASIRHTSSSHERMEQARLALQNTTYTQAVLREQLRTLASRKLNNASVTEIIAKLFPVGKDKTEPSTRTENKQKKFLEIFEYNDGDAVPSIRGTAYNAFNSYTNFIDHHVAVAKTDKRGQVTLERLRQESAVFGLGAARKQQALELMLELTKNAPTQSIQSPVYSNGSAIADSAALDAVLDATILN